MSAELGTIITSIDIGTTKICVLIARKNIDDTLDIIGIGTAPSDGLRRGMVVDVTRSVASIKLALQEAEAMAGVKVKEVSVGISGAHIRSVNSQGVVPITAGHVRKCDVTKVLDSARAMPVVDGEKVLHVLPRHFTIDGVETVRDPVGMHAVRLEAEVHIIVGSISSVYNLTQCCRMASLTVKELVLQQLASAEVVLSEDEKELGVGVLDIGGGTSDLALYTRGAICHSMVIPLAGNHFTKDLAIGLRASLNDAERIKREHGTVYPKALNDLTAISVKTASGYESRDVRKADLVRILHPRAQELLEIVKQEIETHQLARYMNAGLVLTGGGSILSSLDELAHHTLQMPVRIGSVRADHNVPQSLCKPMYATAYGILLYTIKNKSNTDFDCSEAGVAARVFVRMKSWISDLF